MLQPDERDCDMTSWRTDAAQRVAVPARTGLVLASRRRRSDGDADFDAHRAGGVRRGDVEAEARAVDDARRQRRHGPGDGTTIRRCPSSDRTARATCRPGRRRSGTCRASAPPAARSARGARRTSRRASCVASTSAGRRLAEKRTAHALHDVADRRKVDRDLVRKAGPRRRLPGGRPARRRAAVEDDTVRDA